MKIVLAVALTLALAGCSGCVSDAGPDAGTEQIDVAAEAGTAAYCNPVCEIAGGEGCRKIVDACDNDPRRFIMLEDTYSLDCRNAMSAACGGPWGVGLCKKGCQGLRDD